MRKAIIFFAILSGFVLLATDAHAEGDVYRWVDENGAVHFGDNPGEKEGVEKVDIRTGKNTARNPSAESMNDTAQASPPPDQPQPSVAQQRREARAEKKREAAKQRAATEANCAEATKRIAALEPSTRVMVENEDGTIGRLDDNKRLELLEEAKTYVAENCDN